MSARPAELRALTGARGVAAWLVVFYHIRLSIAGLPPWVMAALAKGYLAVDFFFLLSGFVMWLAWSERLREGNGAARLFWLKRIARVWPLHLVMLGLAIAIAGVLAATGRDASVRFPIAELPLHLLLMQDWGFTDRLSWNDPAWSISAEWAAYLFFPPGVLLIDWRRCGTPTILVALAVLFGLLHAVFVRHHATSLGYDIAHLGLARCLVEFAAGTAVCALWTRWRNRPITPVLIASALALGIAAGLAIGVLPETLAVPPMLAALLLVLAFSSAHSANVLEARVPYLLGEISFATYLSHFLLFFFFKLALVSDARAIPLALMALYLAAVLMASFSLHYLIEQPARQWIEALPARLAAKRKRGDRIAPLG